MRRRIPSVILVVFLVACARQTENLHPITLLSPAGQHIEIQVEIADTPDERSRGLMFRTELPAERGMLFIFEEPEILSFWMKNTLLPLDILFLDGAGRIVAQATMEPCQADPCLTYTSATAARYALEVPSGFIQKYGVGQGWRLVLWGVPGARRLR